MKKLIFILFAILFFFVPLILWPFTSEVFEFNKMVLVYILATIITAAWMSRCLVERRLVFRRTILDTPLLIFIGSQFISTILSIDPLTSWLGYYSRFNGGLLSTICYSLLYWTFVSNLDAKAALNSVRVMLISAGVVSIYGVLEHFGIDKSLWVQDVQSRVFSTLGQPNWLAAWLVALIPITWTLMLNYKLQITNYKFWIYFSISVLFFWTLIFTKSRSGLFGFGVAAVTFWGLVIWFGNKEIKKLSLPFVAVGVSILIICLISGTQWTPSLYSLINHSSNQPASQPQGPALETGGTESGKIREIVWKGAVQVWAHYPVFGAGVETFAYSYYKYRPAEHNLVSEWDFIYNKAHNEFLNMAANSGTVGLLSYLFLIGSSIYLILKSKNEDRNMTFALAAGYASLSATNFFGFSVVPTQLQLFLFPAIAVALANVQQTTNNKQPKSLGSFQKFALLIVVSCMSIVIFSIAKYWFADTLYLKGKNYNGVQKSDVALPYLNRAIALEPNQSLYRSELASSYTYFALGYYQQKNTDKAKEFANLAISESDKAIAESGANVNLRRLRFGVFIRLLSLDSNYLIQARDTLIEAINYAPTDAKLYYNLGLTYARTGQADLALQTLQKTVDLKANYRDARLAYAILLSEVKENAKAREQLNYILTNIDPNDSLAKQTLEGIK